MPPKDYSNQKAGTRISTSLLGKVAEDLGIKKGLTKGQLNLVKADINKKNVSQILKRRLGIGLGIGVLVDEILPMIQSYYNSIPMKTVRNQKIDYQKQFATAMGLNKSKSKNTSPPSAEAKDRKNVKTATPKSYKIKKGDSLSEISINTGISVTKLKSLNNIKNADMIKTGNRLKLK